MPTDSGSTVAGSIAAPASHQSSAEGTFLKIKGHIEIIHGSKVSILALALRFYCRRVGGLERTMNRFLPEKE